MVELRFSTDIDAARVVERLGELDGAANESEVSLHLAQSSSERAAALVALASWFAERIAAGRATRVEASREAVVPARMLRLLGEGASLGMTAVGPNAHEFLRIRDLRSARLLSERVVTAIETRVPSFSPSVLRMARFVFEELGANIVQHSGRSDTGFGTLTYDESSRRLELAFADRGVGFLQSLQRNPELEGRIADDSEALQLALTPRITGTGEGRKNMGIGLKQLVEFSDLLDGELWIVSGSAALHRRTLAGVRSNTLRSIPTWRGTWIALEATLT